MRQRDVVIIGGGPAGRVIVHALHSQNSSKSVTLIKDEENNVNRCAVPYGISDNKPIEKFKIPNKLVTDFGAELVVYRAVKIDTNRKQVHTQNGQSYGYQDLVLATGSKPLVPPIAGVDLAGVTPVRSLKDLVTLRGFAAAGQKAVIVGGGYIGIEVAVVLRQMGLEVDVVEMLPQMLMAATEPEFITDVEKTLDAEGVRLLTNRKVAEFRNRNGRGVDIKLENGETLAADFAVLSVGVVPNIELAAEAGIQMGATLEDLLSYQYATHPELAAKPSDNAYVFAARDAYDKL